MADDRVTITPYRDGPLLVRGPFTLLDQDGNEIEIGRDVVALCRCGRSRMKPLCDSTHKAIGFKAPSGPAARLATATATATATAPPAAA
jgi:CDGSH-type Zn-finger protein